MVAHSYSRGHPIEYVSDQWRYMDNHQRVDVVRPCTRCGRLPTEQGHDACLGHLGSVSSACCGHGREEAFIIV